MRKFCFVFMWTLLLSLTSGQTPSGKKWKTLNGTAPLVIAKGGFSGIFPESSGYAYKFAVSRSSPDTVLWCDLHLTKDNVGICLSEELNLANYTWNASQTFTQTPKTYIVNGVKTTGYFAADFPIDFFSDFFVSQRIRNGFRTAVFDGLIICTVDDMLSIASNTSQPRRLWLNVQYELFYRQRKINMTEFILSTSIDINVSYISSPEVAFLRNLKTAGIDGRGTQLIFRFLDREASEPSTNQTYSTLLKNLTFIKTFASGIIVPKSYIWPVTQNLYLLPSTSIVAEARKNGLEIYASEFSNDQLYSYNYSYDPVAEYLSYVDNGQFSVDGVLSSFPLTASVAIDCYSGINKTSVRNANLTIITNNGASGIYPGSTDLAYEKAVDDGADFIDCSVQVTKDGTLVCLNSVDLQKGTTVQSSPFSSKLSEIPGLLDTPKGIYTFNLTWEEIQKLKPQISEFDPNMLRNPAYTNNGRFMTVSEFLSFAQERSSGILLIVENAPFLTGNLSLNVVDNMITTLKNTRFHSQLNKKVMIQSSSSSTLIKLKKETNYTLIYTINNIVSDIDAEAIKYIRGFADAVAISKYSIFLYNPDDFLVRNSGIVKKLKSVNLSVFASNFVNEPTSLKLDTFLDPTVDINTILLSANVDGIITDFPGTAEAYRKNTCFRKKLPYSLVFVPGELMKYMTFSPQPLGSFPVVGIKNVTEPNFPTISSPSPTDPPASSPPTNNEQPRKQHSSSLVLFIISISGSLLLV